MDEDLEVVLVSYDRDFDRAIACINSIRKYGILDHQIKINLVVNDSKKIFEKFKSTVNNAVVWHHSEISDWNMELNWWSQQWFKLAISRHIKTSWYMIIDSDIIQTSTVHRQDCFKDGRAYCKLNPVTCYDTDSPEHRYFRGFLMKACKKWNVPLQNVNWIMREVPPSIFHTTTARNLLDECDQTIFYRKATCEFFLYWIYVISKNLQDRLYVDNQKWFDLGTTFRSH
jgi:hypothetical protein